MANYNETTLKVLEMLSKKPSTIEALAKRLGCSRSNVTTILSKLLKFGRVEREKVEIGEPVKIQFTNPPVTRPNTAYLYSVTKDGLGRIEYLKSQNA